jgi:hypothetical protein
MLTITRRVFGSGFAFATTRSKVNRPHSGNEDEAVGG